MAPAPQIAAEVVLSVIDDRAGIVEVLEQGALGCIPKSSSRAVILHTLRLVLSGGIYIPLEALQVLQAPRAQPLPVAAAPTLSARQMQTLNLLAKGKPNKLIAAEFTIAEATVKAHVTEIFRALKVTNRAQALLAAQALFPNGDSRIS